MVSWADECRSMSSYFTPRNHRATRGAQSRDGEDWTSQQHAQPTPSLKSGVIGAESKANFRSSCKLVGRNPRCTKMLYALSILELQNRVCASPKCGGVVFWSRSLQAALNQPVCSPACRSGGSNLSVTGAPSLSMRALRKPMNFCGSTWASGIAGNTFSYRPLLRSSATDSVGARATQRNTAPWHSGQNSKWGGHAEVSRAFFAAEQISKHWRTLRRCSSC